MGGRKSIEVVMYDFTGKFIRTFESMNEFRRTYFSDDVGNRPLFVREAGNHKYELLDEGIAFTERVGRDKALYVLDIINSPYCKKSDLGETPVEVINLEGDVVAEFRSLRLLTKMMPHIKQSTISYSLNNTKNHNKRGGCGLKFRYKTKIN